MDPEIIENIKTILKEGGYDLEDQELMDSLITIDNLTKLWLDSFEKLIFNGKTLQELLTGNL